MNTLFPVILPVPESVICLTGRQKVRALSRHARTAACRSAFRAGFGPLDPSGFTKTPSGVPRPRSGLYWSVSHKPSRVCGVVSRDPVGIDIEEIRPVSDRLFRRIVSGKEAEMFDVSSRKEIFFRVFTAKEAALKQFGAGLSRLDRVCVVRVDGCRQLTLALGDVKTKVAHFYLDGCLASVTKGVFEVDWQSAAGL